MVDRYKILKIILKSLLFITICKYTVVYCSVDYEVQLLQDKISTHNARARPVLNVSEKVEVTIYMNIYELKEVDTKNQFISVIGWVGIGWNDERIQWNTSDYGGIDMIAVYPYDIWVPTFVLGNTRAEHLYSEEWFNFYKVKVFNDGRVFWAPGGLFTANCYMDVRYFPFDQQICFFKFENWVYDGNSVNITYTDFAETTYLTYYNNRNGQFSIEGVKVIRRDVYFDSSPTPYPQVLFGLHLKRKSLFYIVNIILSSFLFIALFLAAFKLHPECGERISLGITLLLAFTIFVLMVQSSIPETSQNVPLIIVYLILTMFLTSLGILESVLVLYFHYHKKDNPPPNWLYKLTTFPAKHASVSDSNSYKENNASDIPYKEQEDEKKKSKNQRKSNAESWKLVAENIDKLSFWIFLILYIIMIFIICLIIPLSIPAKDLDDTISWAGF